MINRGLFIKAFSKLEFENDYLIMNFMATEINKSNSNELLKEFGESPYNLATLPQEIKFENFKEKIVQIQIIEGRANSPLMLTIYTDKSSLTISKSWFRNEQVFTFDSFINFIFIIKRMDNIKFVNDTINFLKYGE